MKFRQRGAAILTAMLTVTLVATFAAAALWQQWRSVEVESAERSRIQSAWILTGALDWARLILREDARSSPGVDHLAEPWAVPLEEARLSTFLAADRNAAADPNSEAENTFLSGQIIDQQSLLNVNNLAAGGAISTVWLPRFQRLFELLGLPASQLSSFAENLRFASDLHTDNRSSPQARLAPTRVEQLVWLGLPLESVAALQPYITVLPRGDGRVNLNTASAEVIYAALSGITMADARRLVAERERSHFRTLADAQRLLPQYPGAFTEGTVGVVSSYFEVIGRLRLNDVTVQERSLVYRNDTVVNTLYRERGVADATALSQAAAGPKR